MTSRFWAIFCLFIMGGAGSCNAAADPIDPAKERPVANILIDGPADFTRALASAKGGETFILAPGDYGNVGLYKLNFDQPITIRSQNLSNQAHFDRLDIADSKNLVLSDLNIGSALAAGEQAVTWNAAAKVRGSSNIVLDNVDIVGTQDNDPLNDRIGLFVSQSSKVTVVDGEFSNLRQGAHFQQSTDLVLNNNEVHDIRIDGFSFAEVQRVAIEENRFRDFWRQNGDHSDAIQFWTAGTKAASTDIVIKDNQIMQGVGTGQQGIFLGDETRNLPYERLVIENNLIYVSTEYNGISVYGGKDVRVVSNSVLSAEDAAIDPFLRVSHVEGGIVTGNIAATFVTEGNTNVQFEENIDLRKNPSSISSLTGLDSKNTTDPLHLILSSGAGYQIPSDQKPETPDMSNPDTSIPDTSTPPKVGGISGALGEALAQQLIPLEVALQLQNEAKILIHSKVPDMSADHHETYGEGSDIGPISEHAILNIMASNLSQPQYH